MNLLKNVNSMLWVCSILLLFQCNEVYGFQQPEIDSLQYYIKLASSPKNENSLTKAYRFFDSGKTESIKQKDTMFTVFYLQQISSIQYLIGDYYGSEESVVEALTLLQNSSTENANSNKVALYNRLGKIKDELLDYETALKYYDKGLSIAKNTRYINVLQTNKAVIFKKQNKLDIAEQEFLNIYKTSVQLGDQEQISRALDNLGFVQAKLNKPEGFENMLKALELNLNIKNNISLFRSYRHLSESYKDRGQLEDAKLYAEKSYEIAKRINSPRFLNKALKNLITIDSDPKILSYLEVSDSLYNIKNLQDNKYSKVKYDYSQNESLTREIELKKEREKRWKITFLSLGIILILMSGLAIVFQKLKYRKERLSQVYNTEKRISKKIHDEVANDLHLVLNKLQLLPNINEDIIDDLDKIYIRTRDISKENGNLDVSNNFDELLNDMLQGYKTSEVNIITRSISEINWDKVESYKKITIFRVIQELLVNMKKHSDASVVVFTFSRIKKKIEIKYSDNGVGCEINMGSGLQNMETRIKSTNGTIIFETKPNKGFKAKIII